MQPQLEIRIRRAARRAKLYADLSLRGEGRTRDDVMLAAGRGCGVVGMQAAASSVGEWVPDGLSGFICDWDPRFNVTGSPITNWAPRSGLGYQLTPAGTDPTLDATGWVTSAGVTYPSVLFDGVNDELFATGSVGGLTIPARMIGGNDQPGWIIAVTQVISTTGNRCLLCLSNTGGAGNTAQYTLLARFGTPDWALFKQGDGGTGDVATISTSGPDNLRNVFVLNALGTTGKFGINGAVTSGAQDTTNLTSNRLELGARNGVNYTNMRLARLVVGSGSLSDYEMDKVAAGFAFYL